MDAAFLAAAVLRPHYCLGVRLHPLTLGHWFLLEELQSSLVANPPSADMAEILLAIFVCSYADAASARRNLRGWRFRFLSWMWGFRWWRADQLLEFDLFLAYLVEQRSMPAAVIPANAPKRSLHAPQCWRLAATLICDCGLSWAEAMRFPVLRANALRAAHEEKSGAVQLTSDADRQRISDMLQAAARTEGE